MGQALCEGGLMHLRKKKKSIDTVTGDHSFKHGCISIKIQYLTTAIGRILFSSLVMVLAFDARSQQFESCPGLIFLPCIYSFVSLLRTLFVRTQVNPGRLTRAETFCY